MLNYRYLLIATLVPILFTCTGCDNGSSSDRDDDTDSSTAHTDSDSDSILDSDDDSDTDEPDSDDYALECLEQGTWTGCDDAADPPASDDDRIEFLQTNAISLWCGQTADDGWNFTIFRREFEGKRLFMFGEIHGSNELGIASAALFDALVRYEGVEVLALEIGMDAGGAIKQFIETGSGPYLTQYGMETMSENMMWRKLPVQAQILAEDGFEVEPYGVDVPMRLAWVNEQIEIIAGQLGGQAATLLLDTLPAKIELGQPAYRQYVIDAQAYYDRFLSNKTEICEDLDSLTCQFLETAILGLKLGAFVSSPQFWNSSDQQLAAWFAQREDLIFKNYAMIFESTGARIYSHMGAFHTAQAGASVGEMLSTLHEPSKGKVYSTTASYGQGSMVIYAGEMVPLEPTPELMADALESRESDSYFVSISKPGKECVENPLQEIIGPEPPLPYGETHDGFVWFRTLTPEIASMSLSANVSPAVTFAIRERNKRIQFANTVLASKIEQ